jgi:hypothetical protein
MYRSIHYFKARRVRQLQLFASSGRILRSCSVSSEDAALKPLVLGSTAIVLPLLLENTGIGIVVFGVS